MKSQSTKSQSTSPGVSELNQRKQRAFIVILVMFPFVLVFAAELVLRMIGYGADYDLVIRTSIAGKEYYTINRRAAAKYFTGSGTTIPEPSEDIFEIRKDSRTKRIFCLGESTMAGFPYEFHATAPSFLKDRLSALLPDYTFEVINVGVSAVSSYIVLDFMEQLKWYEPDLYVVYVGHNEFYGAYGSASTVSISGGSWLTRLSISLLKSRFFLLTREGYLWLRSQFLSSQSRPTGSLMAQMVANQSIPYGSDTYVKTRRAYRENLQRLISTATSHGVPILFSALVSNLKTQAPFVPLFHPSTTNEVRSHIQDLLTEADSLVSLGKHDDAVRRCLDAVALDSSYALAQFNLGQILYSSGRYTEARRAFVRAKDLDGLRFRASEDFTAELIDICAVNQIPLARVDSAFDAGSANGIPGNEMILEHLHPTIDGYFLMAKTLAETMRANDIPVPQQDWNPVTHVSDEELMALSTVSEFDHAMGRIKVELLMRRWPFSSDPVDYRFIPRDAIENVAFSYIQKRVAWSDARYKLADIYANAQMHDLARRECLAVARVLPMSYQPLLKVGDYYRDEGRNADAKTMYRKCFDTEENPFCRMKLALILLEEGNLAGCEQQIQLALAADSRGPHKMTTAAAASARYLLGVTLARQAKYAQAEESLRNALVLQPGFEEANDLLQQILRLGMSTP